MSKIAQQKSSAKPAPAFLTELPPISSFSTSEIRAEFVRRNTLGAVRKALGLLPGANDDLVRAEIEMLLGRTGAAQ